MIVVRLPGRGILSVPESGSRCIQLGSPLLPAFGFVGTVPKRRQAKGNKPFESSIYPESIHEHMHELQN